MLNMEVPNILNPRGIPPWKLLRLEGLDTPQARLALVGGLPGFLSHMQKDGVNVPMGQFSEIKEHFITNTFFFPVYFSLKFD